MNRNIFKKITSIMFLFLSVATLGSCGNPEVNPGSDKDKEEENAFTIELGKHELDLVMGTSERIAYDFLPDIPDDYTVEWVSSDPEIATVNSSGLVKGLKHGTVTITATMNQGGASDKCVVKVGDAVDYVSELKLDMNSDTKKAEVTTHLHIDGDTTHFNIDPKYGYGPAAETGILKARYLGCDTPESTGQIDPWGKKASKFTKDIVTNAHKIIIESDDDKWNLDSTSSRCLVWVWYQMNDGDDFRCLNVELLQNGLAKPKNTAATRYGKVATAALDQAKAQELYVHGSERDPDYYYGKCILTTLKDIRTHLTSYVGKYVSFDCTVAKVIGQTVYVEDYDETDNINYGMQVYLGFTQLSDVKAMTYPDYRIRVAGSLQFYEAGGTYQVADPQFSSYAEPDSPESFHLFATNVENTDKKAKFPEYNVTDFADTRVFSITEFVEEEDTGDYIEVTHEKSFRLGDLITSSSAMVKNLTVTSAYTTATGDSKGAISLACKDPSNNTFTVRTEVLTENGAVVTQDRYLNKTINVKGIVDYYSGSFQLKVLSVNDIEIVS